MAKRILFILLLASIFFQTKGQVRFQASNGYFQIPEAIAQTADHGYIIGGQILDTMCGNCDISSLLKLDSLGNEQWEKLYPVPGGHDSYVTSLFQASDGNYIFCGYDNLLSASMILYKASPSGQLVWMRTFGQYLEYTRCLTLETADHNYIICGSQSIGNNDYLSLIKISPSGNVIWEKNYSDTVLPIGYCNDLVQTSDSGFLLTGGNVYGGAFLLRTDSTGLPQWYKLYGDSLDWGLGHSIAAGNSVQQTFDGGFICAGSDFVTPHGMVFKTDQNGDTLWTKKITGPEYHIIKRIVQTPDSNYVLIGSIGDGNSFSENILLLKMDQSGNLIWARTYGDLNPYNKIGKYVVNTSDGGLAILGVTFVGTHVIKTGSDGILSCNMLNSTTWIEPHPFDIPSRSLIFDTLENLGSSGMLEQLYPMRTTTDCISIGGGCSAGFYLYPDTTQPHHYIATNSASGTSPISYTWYWGDGTFDTIPYPSHVYADTGFYDICLEIIDSTGCSHTFCDSSFHILRSSNTMAYVNVVPEFTTGTAENNSYSQRIHFYPNPSAGVFTLSSDGFLKGENINGTIYNMLGEDILNMKFLWGEINEINISKLSSGIYFISIQTKERKFFGKLIKE